MLAPLAVIAAAMCVLAHAAHGLTIYVAWDGSDAFCGSSRTKAAATLDHALHSCRGDDTTDLLVLIDGSVNISLAFTPPVGLNTTLQALGGDGSTGGKATIQAQLESPYDPRDQDNSLFTLPTGTSLQIYDVDLLLVDTQYSAQFVNLQGGALDIHTMDLQRVSGIMSSFVYSKSTAGARLTHVTARSLICDGGSSLVEQHGPGTVTLDTWLIDNAVTCNLYQRGRGTLVVENLLWRNSTSVRIDALDGQTTLRNVTVVDASATTTIAFRFGASATQPLTIDGLTIKGVTTALSIRALIFVRISAGATATLDNVHISDSGLEVSTPTQQSQICEEAGENPRLFAYLALCFETGATNATTVTSNGMTIDIDDRRFKSSNAIFAFSSRVTSLPVLKLDGAAVSVTWRESDTGRSVAPRFVLAIGTELLMTKSSLQLQSEMTKSANSPIGISVALSGRATITDSDVTWSVGSGLACSTAGYMTIDRLTLSESSSTAAIDIEDSCSVAITNSDLFISADAAVAVSGGAQLNMRNTSFSLTGTTVGILPSGLSSTEMDQCSVRLADVTRVGDVTGGAHLTIVDLDVVVIDSRSAFPLLDVESGAIVRMERVNVTGRDDVVYGRWPWFSASSSSVYAQLAVNDVHVSDRFVAPDLLGNHSFVTIAQGSGEVLFSNAFVDNSTFGLVRSSERVHISSCFIDSWLDHRFYPSSAVSRPIVLEQAAELVVTDSALCGPMPVSCEPGTSITGSFSANMSAFASLPCDVTWTPFATSVAKLSERVGTTYATCLGFPSEWLVDVSADIERFNVTVVPDTSLSRCATAHAELMLRTEIGEVRGVNRLGGGPVTVGLGAHDGVLERGKPVNMSIIVTQVSPEAGPRYCKYSVSAQRELVSLDLAGSDVAFSPLTFGVAFTSTHLTLTVVVRDSYDSVLDYDPPNLVLRLEDEAGNGVTHLKPSTVSKGQLLYDNVRLAHGGTYTVALALPQSNTFTSPSASLRIVWIGWVYIGSSAIGLIIVFLLSYVGRLMWKSAKKRVSEKAIERYLLEDYEEDVGPLGSLVAGQLEGLDELPLNVQGVPQFDFEDVKGALNEDGLLGRGGNGDVYLVKWKGAYVAIKCVRIHQNASMQSARDAFAEEVALMFHADCPNILRVFGACFKPPTLAVILEYMSRGSLFDLLHCTNNDSIDMNGKVTTTTTTTTATTTTTGESSDAPPKGSGLTLLERLWLAVQLARGVHYLHSQSPPIVHRDLKSLNLLVSGPSLSLKVADFGLARQTFQTLGATTQGGMTGSPAWMPCEALLGLAIDERSDIYSLGVILYEIGCERQPWMGMAFADIVREVGLLKCSLDLSDFDEVFVRLSGASADMAARFRNVAARCMSPEPADRPDAGWVLAELEALHSEATAANVYGTPPCGDHDDDVPEE